jgi:hypothetical protein
VAAPRHPDVGDVRERVPDLLAVDDPLVAVADRTSCQRREIGARTRLGEQLAPLLLARVQRAQEPALHLFAAVRDDGRSGEEVPEEDAAAALCSTGRTQPALDFALQRGTHAEPAVTDREVHPRQARVVLRAAERKRALAARIVLREERIDRSMHPLRVVIARSGFHGAICGARGRVRLGRRHRCRA